MCSTKCVDKLTNHRAPKEQTKMGWSGPGEAPVGDTIPPKWQPLSLILPVANSRYQTKPGDIVMNGDIPSDVSNMTMSVGVPNEDARVSLTPLKTLCKKAMKSKTVNPLGKKCPFIGIGRRVIVKRKHVHLRLLPGQDTMSALDAHHWKDINMHGTVS